MELEEPYNALRRRWIRARQILRALTPEAGETYKFYQDEVAKLDAQFVRKVELWPDTRNQPKKGRGKKQKLTPILTPIQFNPELSWD